MRHLVALTLAAGCNQVFGLASTDRIRPDAPPSCPPIGTAPHFGYRLHQAVMQDCTGYTLSEDGSLALAQCYEVNGSTYGFQVETGPGDGTLLPTSIAPTAGYTMLSSPRLAPEGNALVTSQYGSNGSMVSVYERGATGDWLWAGDTGIVAGQISEPTRGPERHMILANALDGNTHEFAGTDTGPWTDVATYTASDLGGEVTFPTLTADGLRFVFSDGKQVFYSDRPSLDARFSVAVEVPNVPPVSDLFLTEDCTRLYLNGLGYVLYLYQTSN